MRTCEHMILGQLTMGARQTKNAPLIIIIMIIIVIIIINMIVILILILTMSGW